MGIKPLVSSVVGPADSVHWGQVLLLPQAYGVVEIEDAGGRAQTLGIGVLTQLSDLLANAPKTLEALEKLAEEVYSQNSLTILLLVPVEGVLYIILKGEGAVYLKRGEQLAGLLFGAGRISGAVRPGDTVLLVSKTIARAMTKAQLASVFDHLPVAESAEKLTLLLHETRRGIGGAALLFHVATNESLADFNPEPAVPVVAIPTSKKQSIKFGHWVAPLRRRIGARIRSLHHMSRSKMILSVITAALFLVFAVSVIAGVIRQSSKVASPQLVSAVAEAQRTFDEGVALLDLNAVKGRAKLEEAKSLLTPYLSTVSPKSKEGREITALYDQITARLTLALHSVTAEPQLFYDVSLLKKNGTVSSFAMEDDNLAIGDASTQTIYKVGLSAKNGAIISGGAQYDNLSAVSLHGDRIYVLTPNGIEGVSLTDKTAKLLIKKDAEWGTILSMVSFGGNLYLLDTIKSRIWKYVSTEGGYSDLREYLNPDTLPDLSKAINMAIDGSVWLGTSNGKILKFTQGKEDTFLTAGISPGLGSKLLVYTSDSTKMLYVLDSDNKRVIVLDKNGSYVAQYVWQGSISPSTFAVSESNHKIILLFDGKLYTLELN